jgi:hypothetical protein
MLRAFATKSTFHQFHQYLAAPLRRRYWRAAHTTAGSDLGQLRRLFKCAYLANSGYDRDIALAATRAGDAEVVARLKLGARLNTAERGTFYGGGVYGYTNFPSLNHNAA